MSNKTNFEPGMMVSCRKTYQSFTGRVIRSIGQPLYRPGEVFIVLSFKDGKEYDVCEYSMERVADPEMTAQLKLVG
jgi:hypothetical protein